MSKIFNRSALAVSSPGYFRPVEDKNFFRDVLVWLAVSFFVAAIGTFLIGPFVPVFVSLALSLGLVAAMLLLSFKKTISKGLARFLLIAAPLIMGIALYPLLFFYLKTNPGIIVQAALGTAVLFGGAAILAFKSEKMLKTKFLFAALVAIILMSLVNLFLGLSLLSLFISIAAVVIFTLFSYHDIQAIRQGGGGIPSELAALSIFLDIFNIFSSLLNILGFFSGD